MMTKAALLLVVCPPAIVARDTLFTVYIWNDLVPLTYPSVPGYDEVVVQQQYKLSSEE